MSTWISDSILANGISIYYYRTGGTKPPLVLLHGITDNGLCWTPVAKALEADYDVIMLDARGHGLSDRITDDIFSLELLAADAAGAIQALKLQKPILLGHSMGAATAALLAMRHPELVCALSLEDPPWGNTTPDLTDAAPTTEKNTWLRWLVPTRAQPRAERIELARIANPSWSDDDLEPWADSKEQFQLSVVERNVNAALFLPPWREIVAHITCPTLLLIGDVERDAIVTPEVAQEATQITPNVQVAHIANAGHSIRRDQLSSYLETIRPFLHAQQC